MKSTKFFLLASAFLVNLAESGWNEKVECITIDCKMKSKSMKVPRNILIRDPVAYYGGYPSSSQSRAYGYPAYHYYYGYSTPSNPASMNGNQYQAYTAYNSYPGTYWANAYTYPYDYQRTQSSHPYIPVAVPQVYCPTCSQERSSLQPVANSHPVGTENTPTDANSSLAYTQL